MRIFLLFALFCLSWGTTWIAIRLGVALVPPVFFAGSRFFVAGAVLLLFCLARGARWPRSFFANPFLHLTSFLIIAVTFGLIFWGEKFVSAGMTAVVVQGLIPIFLPFFVALLSQEPFTPKMLVVAALGVFGLYLLFHDGMTYGGPDIVWGVCALVVGTLAYCLGSAFSRRYMVGVPVLELSGWQNFLGGVVLLVYSAVFEPVSAVPLEVWLAPQVVWSWMHLVVIGSILGFTLYLYMLKTLGAARCSTYAFLTPVIALLIDAYAIGVAFTPLQKGGMAVILLAVLLSFLPLKFGAHGGGWRFLFRPKGS